MEKKRSNLWRDGRVLAFIPMRKKSLQFSVQVWILPSGIVVDSDDEVVNVEL
jgi:hypothetical protein